MKEDAKNVLNLYKSWRSWRQAVAPYTGDYKGAKDNTLDGFMAWIEYFYLPNNV